MTLRARGRRAVRGFLSAEDPPAIQARLDDINHQVVQIQVRLDEINHQVVHIEARLGGLVQERLDQINHQVVHISEGRLGGLDGELKDLRRRVDETDEALRYMFGEVSQGSQRLLDLVLAIHHESVETAAHLHAIVEEVRAEREATFASNDAASVRLGEVIQELARFGRLAALGAEQLEGTLDRRTLPDMLTIESSIDHARELVEVARSQYRDVMPKDAVPIAPLRP